MPFGELQCVVIGEKGRGRQEVLIPSPVNLTAGINKDVTIKLSKTGKPKIVKEKNKKLFLVLETKLGYTRRGNGFVQTTDPQKLEVLASGNSADGDAGRIGSAMAYVIEVKAGDLFFGVKMGGGNPTRLYHIDHEFVVRDLGSYDSDELDITIEHYGLELPAKGSYRKL